jgi:pilus assembly protein Flp/PilA
MIISILNKSLKLKIWLEIWNDTHGQDLMEYALMAGFLAAASAVTLPQVASSISNVLANVVSMLSANATGTAPGA